MTDPICSQRPHPNLDLTLIGGKAINEAFNESAKEVTGKRVETNGPGFDEQQEIDRRKTVSEGVAFLKSNLEDIRDGIEGKPWKIPLVGFEVIKFSAEHVLAAEAKGKALNDAAVRDGYTYAILMIAKPTIFPEGYIPARAKQVQVGARVEQAIRFRAEKQLGAEAYKGLVITINRNAREGQDAALANGITSKNLLEEHCTMDSAFRDRYQNNIAFREGVNSMVWLAHERPKELEDRAQLIFQQLFPCNGR